MVGTTAHCACSMRVKVTDIRARYLPDSPITHRTRKHFVELALNNNTQKTEVAERAILPSWEGGFDFDTDNNNVILELHVWAHHRIRFDEYVGGTKVDINALLKEAAPGDFKTTTLELCTCDAGKGTCHALQATIEFTVTKMGSAAGLHPFNPPINQPQWVPLLDKLNNLIKIVDIVAEVHPYAKLAWIAVSATYQLVLAQRDRDDNIEHLVGTMNNAFAFVQGATDAVLDKVKSHKEVVQHMAQLAIECAYFIRGYSKTRSFLSRAIKHSMSTVDIKINQYEKKFEELQRLLQTHAILRALGILENLDHLAKQGNFDDMLHAKGLFFGERSHDSHGCLADHFD